MQLWSTMSRITKFVQAELYVNFIVVHPVSEFSEALEEENKPENPHFLSIRPLSLLLPCRLKTVHTRMKKG